MHGWMQRHPAAEGLGERLVAEADTGRGYSGLRHPSHDLERDAGLVRRARPGRNHAPFIALALKELCHGRAVVAHGLHVGAQLAQVLDEVVGERVIVVDDEDSHVQSGCSQAGAIALMAALDLAPDSSYSYSGFASATVPPPACTWATPSLTTTVRMWIAVSRSPA